MLVKMLALAPRELPAVPEAWQAASERDRRRAAARRTEKIRIELSFGLKVIGICKN